MATPQPRTGNPFAPQPSLPASTAIPPSHPVAQTSGSGEEDKQLTATLYSYPPEYPPEPATGYPVYSAGGAFTSSYPHFGQPSGSSPYHPGHAAQSSTPLYTFEQSAPPYQDQPRLQCGGLGTQWVLFIVGWLLWPLWYLGVILRWMGRFDPRERAGWLANCVMSVIFTLVWVSLLATRNYHNHYDPNDPDVLCTDPLTCIP